MRNTTLFTSTVLLSALATAGVARGQSAYFAFEGAFLSPGDAHEFGLWVDGTDSTNSPQLRFQTYADAGTSANAAGDAIAPAGLDTALELTINYSREDRFGFSDTADIGSGSLDALLSWPGVAPDPALGDSPLGPEPLPSAGDLLVLTSPSAGTGDWSLDLVGPLDQALLNAATPVGTSEVRSLKIGTTNAGGQVFHASLNDGFEVHGPVTVGHTGVVDWDISTQTPLTAHGLTTINPQSALRGTFLLPGGVEVIGGTLEHQGVFSNVPTAFGSLLASEGAQVTLDHARFGGGPTPGGPGAELIFQTGAVGEFNRLNIGSDPAISSTPASFAVQSGAQVTMFGLLEVGGGGMTGSMLIEGAGSRVYHRLADAYFGKDGGTASLTVRDLGEWEPEQGQVYLASNVDSTADLLVETGASIDLWGLYVGNRTVFEASDNQHATINIDGSGTTAVIRYLSLGGQAPVDPLDSSASALTVRNGAGLTLNNGEINRTGFLRVEPDASLALAQSSSTVLVQGGRLEVDGTLDFNGHFQNLIQVDSGGTFVWLTPTNDPDAVVLGRVNVDGEGSLFEETRAVGTHSARLNAGGLRVSDGGEARIKSLWLRGEVIVEGAGSTLRTTGSELIDKVGIHSELYSPLNRLRVLNDARVLLASNGGPLKTLRVGDDSIRAQIDIRSGGYLGLDHLVLADASDVIPWASINVTGAGSVIEQQGASTLTAGSASRPFGYEAAVHVGRGAAFHTGTGDTVFHRNAHLWVEGGHFNARGHLIFSPGNLSKVLGGYDEPAITAESLTIVEGSKVEVRLAYGFTPVPGDVFPLIRSQTPILGQFIMGALIGQPGTGFYVEPLQTATTIDLRLMQASAGDTDYDGDVDNADLQAMIASFTGPEGIAMLWRDGDFDGDGDVDNSDLQTAIAGFTGPINTPVPELASVAVLAGISLILGRRRRMG